MARSQPSNERLPDIPGTPGERWSRQPFKRARSLREYQELVPEYWHDDQHELRLRVNDLAAQDDYLNAIPRVYTTTNAAKVAGVSFDVIQRWRMDPDFQAREQQARSMVADMLESEALKRALKGERKPVYQGGALVGYTQEKSDPLLVMLLKAAHPEKYRERSEVTVRPIVKVVAGFEPQDVL